VMFELKKGLERGDRTHRARGYGDVPLPVGRIRHWGMIFNNHSSQFWI
jgi:hypothetical protein